MADINLFHDSNSGTDTLVADYPTACFHSNVSIATPNGSIAVQDLIAGDLVLGMEQNATVERLVKWVGSHTVFTAGIVSHDNYPIRIRSSALTEGRPHRDLLINGKHCIRIDGRMIPVSMLVNGSSIVIERRIVSFTIHHVELDRHSVMLADGLEVESYLDTGNRSILYTTSTNVDVTSATWNDDAASQTIDRKIVEAISARLVARAKFLNYPRFC